jgi:hypothetical protein
VKRTWLNFDDHDNALLENGLQAGLPLVKFNRGSTVAFDKMAFDGSKGKQTFDVRRCSQPCPTDLLLKLDSHSVARELYSMLKSTDNETVLAATQIRKFLLKKSPLVFAKQFRQEGLFTEELDAPTTTTLSTPDSAEGLEKCKELIEKLSKSNRKSLITWMINKL